jgi:hypothetical protein
MVPNLLSAHDTSSHSAGAHYTDSQAGLQGMAVTQWLPPQLAWQWGRRLAGAAGRRLQQAVADSSSQVDPKLAALGMGLIVASQVSVLVCGL